MYLWIAVEVMDKEVTVGEAWLFAAVVGFVGFFIAANKPWLAIIPVLAIVIVSASIALELADASLASAIRSEAGRAYPILVFLPMALALVATVLGIRRGFGTHAA